MIIGFVAGAFDLLHPGHILLFKECKRHCDYLLVALQTDCTLDRPAKNRPIETIFERMIRLEGCRYVDEIVVYDTDADGVQVMKVRKPDIRFLGADHKGHQLPGDELNIKTIYIDRNHDFGSGRLRDRIGKDFIMRLKARKDLAESA